MLLRCTWLSGYVATRLGVNGVTRLSGYMGVLHFWLLAATWLRGCMAMWLPSYVAAWLPTCLCGSYAARRLSG